MWQWWIKVWLLTWLALIEIVMSLRHGNLELKISLLLWHWDYSLSRYWCHHIRSLIMLWNSSSRWSNIFFSWICLSNSFEDLFIIQVVYTSGTTFLLSLRSAWTITSRLLNLLLLRIYCIGSSFRTFSRWTPSILTILSTRNSSYVISEVFMKRRSLGLFTN